MDLSSAEKDLLVCRCREHGNDADELFTDGRSA
jgi:hypothetical protein